MAILAVVAAHAGVPWLTGGFIGVDVFFVLSGYLITGLLVQEHRASGRIDFAAFYARRFRRLLPALLVMLAVTCVLGRALLSPDAQPDQAIAAAASAAWLSNFHFAFSDLGYFSSGAETNLFLHTWSLGVEEQFYLVWPALLMLAMGQRMAASNDARRLQTAMLLVLGASLLACVYLTPRSPLVAFYLMPTRAWQFALGALVFLWLGGLETREGANSGADPAKTAPSGDSARPSLRRWVGWLGVALIVAAAAGFDTHMPYPGFRAVIPSMGAALVLIAGARPHAGGIGAVLSLRPMQAIGRVSYGWYLWHWPVFLLGAEISGLHSWMHRLGWGSVSFVLASISYRIVETPIRHSSWMKASPRAVLLGAVSLMICANMLAIRWFNDAGDRMASPERSRYQLARFDAPAIYAMGCDDWYQSTEVRICAFGPDDAAHTAVAIGDSVGLQWFPAFAEAFNRPGWRLLVLTKSSCPMVDEPIFYARIARQYTECERWRKEALERVATLKPDVVILGSTFTYDFTPAQWIDGTARVLSTLSAAVGHIHVLRPTPVLPFDGPTCLAPRSALYTALAGDDRCTSEASNPRSDAVFRWLQTATTRVPNASMLDMTDAVCPAGVCSAERDGMIVFRDTRHLTATFAKSLGPIVARRIDSQHEP